MKRIVSVLLCVTLGFVTSAFSAVSAGASESSAASVSVSFKSSSAKKTAEVVFKTKLYCENCVRKLMENISFVKGVKDLEISMDNQEIKIVYDVKKTDVETLSAEIKKLGYPAVVKRESENK